MYYYYYFYYYLSNLSYLFLTNVPALQLADSLEEVTVLSEVGAVCVETCRRNLINIRYIYIYIYIQLHVCI